LARTSCMWRNAFLSQTHSYLAYPAVNGYNLSGAPIVVGFEELSNT
jgi:hypothetical protein